MKKKTIWFLVSGLIVLGLALRLFCVFSWGDLMFDEMISLAIVLKPWEEIWKYLKIEMHPVAHFYYLKLWLKIWGNTEAAARLSSVFISALCFPALYFLSKKIFNSRKAGLGVIFLFSLSSCFIFYSALTRMYVFLLFFTVLSFYFFLKISNKEKPGFKLHFLYIAVTLIAYHAHLTAACLIAIQLSYLLITKVKKVKKFIWDWLLIIIFYLPWFFFFVKNNFFSLKPEAWYFWANEYQRMILYPFKFIVIGSGQIPHKLYIFLLGGMLFFLFLNLYLNRKKIQWQKLILPFLIFFVPFFVLVVFKLGTIRYSIIPALGLFLILGYFLSRFNYKRLPGIIFLFLFLVLFLNSSVLILKHKTVAWEKGFDFIEEKEKEGDKIILTHDNSLVRLNFYYQGNSPVFSYNSKQYEDKLVQVIENCVYPSDLKRDSKNLPEIIRGSERLFLVVSTEKFGNDQLKIKDWFQKRGWKTEDDYQEGDLNIFLLVKDKDKI